MYSAVAMVTGTRDLLIATSFTTSIHSSLFFKTDIGTFMLQHLVNKTNTDLDSITSDPLRDPKTQAKHGLNGQRPGMELLTLRGTLALLDGPIGRLIALSLLLRDLLPPSLTVLSLTRLTPSSSTASKPIPLRL